MEVDQYQEMNTLTMVINKFKDLSLEVELQSDLTDKNVASEAKRFVRQEALNSSNPEPIQEICAIMKEFEQGEAIGEIHKIIPLLLIEGKQVLEFCEILEKVLISYQNIDKSDYIKISLYLKICAVALVLMNIDSKKFHKNYKHLLCEEVKDCLMFIHYLLLDPEILDHTADIINSVEFLIIKCINDKVYENNELFEKCEEIIYNLVLNPSKCYESCSYNLVAALNYASTDDYHQNFIEYFLQTLISLQKERETMKNVEFQKLKKIIATKIGGAVSLFITPVEEKSPPGLEIVLNYILQNSIRKNGIGIAFMVMSKLSILGPNDPEEKYKDKVEKGIEIYLHLLSEQYADWNDDNKVMYLLPRLIMYIKPLEFFLKLYVTNNYNQCKETPEKIHGYAQIEELIEKLSSFMVKTSQTILKLNEKKSEKESISCSLLEMLLNIIDYLTNYSGCCISFSLFVRILTILKLNFMQDNNLGPLLFRVLKMFSRIQDSADDEKMEKLTKPIQECVNYISKSPDIISFIAMIEYLRDFLQKFDNSDMKIKCKDDYAWKCLDDILTYDYINREEIDLAEYGKNVISKAFCEILKQDLSNNSRIDHSEFIPHYYAKLNKKFGIKHIVDCCFMHFENTSEAFKKKSLEEKVKIKQDCELLLFKNIIQIETDEMEFNKQEAIKVISMHLKETQ
ncbi:unnamed protein product [Moneuplotes crassus]|uniref:Uncharacterized protein n=1 Tax=Euplotes crassus TaxID=5936 RepID=A0AAD1X738_EUPCR|nr:unnamed protein product [Moneuplotes crassus]